MHPVLESVHEHNIGSLVHEDASSLKYLWIFKKKGEYALTTFTADEKSDLVEVSLEIKMRCQVATARNKLYLRALSNKLANTLSVGYMQPRTLLLGGAFGSVGDSEEDILFRLLILNDLSHTMVLATHLNTRLSTEGPRRGSDTFKKVLPSYLASLTVCSILKNAEPN